jgi:hypothetical protein
MRLVARSRQGLSRFDPATFFGVYALDTHTYAAAGLTPAAAVFGLEDISFGRHSFG